LATTPRPWVHAAAKVDATRYLAAADCVAAGKLDLFALQDVGLDSPPRWNRDPKTGVEAPLKFGKLLDYRNTRLVGDIKYLWELNRHLHLVTLAQAYALSRDVRYFHVIWQHLESWFAACPYRMGGAYAPGSRRRRRFWKEKRCCRMRPTASIASRPRRTSSSCSIFC